MTCTTQCGPTRENTYYEEHENKKNKKKCLDTIATIIASTSIMAPSSPLFLSAHELAGRLSTNQTTSAAIATAFLDHIASHNHEGKCLNALISVAPRGSVLAQAAALDDERASGRLRSALHGVPIVVKDCFLTDESLGMTTSAGAAVFATMRSRGNAVAIQRLLDAGLIILGKGNMTEFSGMK